MIKTLNKVKMGIKDEKDGIKYYSTFTNKDKSKLTKQEIKHLMDAKNDEREHLKYLKQDEKTIIGKMRK